MLMQATQKYKELTGMYLKGHHHPQPEKQIKVVSNGIAGQAAIAVGSNMVLVQHTKHKSALLRGPSAAC
jgi:hypothetical protein